MLLRLLPNLYGLQNGALKADRPHDGAICSGGLAGKWPSENIEALLGVMMNAEQTVSYEEFMGQVIAIKMRDVV